MNLLRSTKFRSSFAQYCQSSLPCIVRYFDSILCYDVTCPGLGTTVGSGSLKDPIMVVNITVTFDHVFQLLDSSFMNCRLSIRNLH